MKLYVFQSLSETIKIFDFLARYHQPREELRDVHK